MVFKFTLSVMLLIAANQSIAAIAYPHYSGSIPQLLGSRGDTSQSDPTIFLLSQECIAPNPDIAGIGVRISIYIQSFLSFVLAFTFASDAFVDSHEEKVLYKVYITLLVTASALLLSAFIQAATSELSVYHALIVLNLCWMVTTSTLIIFIFPTIHWRSSYSFWGWARRLWPSNVKQLPVVLLVTTYLCATASLGIWVWTKVAAFGINPECTPEIFTTLFAHNISVTNSSIRILSLVVYAVAAMPGINIAIFTAIAGACSAGVVFAVTALFTRTWFTYRPLYLMAVVVQAFINTLFIVDTELMIRRSRPLVADGESTWTFGQTLALVLVIIPLFEVINVMQPKVQGTEQGKRMMFYVEWWLRGSLRESEQSWDKFYSGVADDILQAREFVRTQRTEPGSGPVSHAFAAAEAALTAAEVGLSAANAVLRPDVSSPNLAAKSPQTIIYIPNIRKAAEKVVHAREVVVRGRSLRFSKEYRNAGHFFAAKASLEIVKSSLDAAKAALDTANTAFNDNSFNIGLSERPASSPQTINSTFS